MARAIRPQHRASCRGFRRPPAALLDSGIPVATLEGPGALLRRWRALCRREACPFSPAVSPILVCLIPGRATCQPDSDLQAARGGARSPRVVSPTCTSPRERRSACVLATPAAKVVPVCTRASPRRAPSMCLIIGGCVCISDENRDQKK